MRDYGIINASMDSHPLYFVVEIVKNGSEKIAECESIDNANIVLAALRLREREIQKQKVSIKYGVVVEPIKATLDPDDGKFIAVEKAGDLTTITIRI